MFRRVPPTNEVQESTEKHGDNTSDETHPEPMSEFTPTQELSDENEQVSALY